jgi:1,4-dihydroxy-2-naphthoate octaprenyltransferase
VQLERLDWLPLALSIPVGLLSTAILVVNNVRDMDTDRRAGKRTLAVLLGRARSRLLYAALVVGAFAGVPAALVAADGPTWGAMALVAAPFAEPPFRAVLTRTDGPALNAALADTGKLLAVFALLLSAGLLVAP